MSGILKAFQALESIKKENQDDDNVLAMIHLGLMKISNSYIPRDLFLDMDITYVLELFDCETKIQAEMDKKMKKNKPKIPAKRGKR